MFRIFDIKYVKWTGTESVLFLVMGVRVVSNNEDTINLAILCIPNAVCAKDYHFADGGHKTQGD